MEVGTIKKIVAYGDRYIEKYLTEFDRNYMREDWWEGLKYLFKRSFAQGRRDTISKKVEKETICILEECIEEHGNNPNAILNKDNFCQIEQTLKI